MDTRLEPGLAQIRHQSMAVSIVLEVEVTREDATNNSVQFIVDGAYGHSGERVQYHVAWACNVVQGLALIRLQVLLEIIVSETGLKHNCVCQLLVQMVVGVTGRHGVHAAQLVAEELGLNRGRVRILLLHLMGNIVLGHMTELNHVQIITVKRNTARPTRVCTVNVLKFFTISFALVTMVSRVVTAIVVCAN
ncbi:uncharacterized protein LOC132739782 [Ruditapes philippinarum]|uniref:uncharacterized protein LOC132739782 n=1 Tax=Ruditapes philippinarum TaxID=129788 RepID=UPI00295BDE60|nr:uncharacterized protein LOC132739782 [Ruditapes philippinarum]